LVGIENRRQPVGNTAQPFFGTAAPTGLRQVLPASDVIVDLVAGDRPQPAAETVPGPIAAEVLDVRRDGKKDLLDDIGSIIGRHPRPPTPSVDQRRIHIDEPLPSRRVPDFDSVQ
jgi:hypothetical protein